MASKSYGWNVRNIAKISPKMVKKRAIFRLQKKIPKPTPLPHMRLWLRLIFENFLMSPKDPPFIFLIFCNRTNVKKFKRVSSFRFFGTMRLLKIRIFFENFSKSPNGPPSIFLNYRKRMDVKKSQRTPLSQFSAS